MSHVHGWRDRAVVAAAVAIACVLAGCSAHVRYGVVPGDASGGAVPPDVRPVTDALAHTRRLIEAGRFPAAESAAAGILARRASAPADPTWTADALELLAEAMLGGGRHWEPEALRALDRALAIRTRDPGPDSLPLAGTLFRLGRLRSARWDSRGALEAFERSQDLRTRASGPESREALAAGRAIALELMAINDRDGAASLLARDAAVLARTVGPDDPAHIESDLALAHLEDHVADTARFANGLERTARVFGHEHPLVARRLVEYSERMRGAGHFARAHQLMAQAHALFERTLGPRNLLTAKAWNLIGVNHIWTGAHDPALPYFEQSHALIRDLMGPDHVEMVKPSLDLGDLLCKLGNEAAGLPMMERAVEIAARELPEDHWLVGLSLYLLGGAYAMGGRQEEARPILERLLALRMRTRPAGSEEIGRAMDLLAQAGGNPRRGRELYEGAARIYLAVYGPGHPLGARGSALLARYRFADGDTAGAIAQCDSANAVFLRTKGPGSLDLGWGRYSLGLMYRACGRHADAVRSMEQAVDAFARSTGAGNMLTAMALRDLGEELVAVNRNRDAFRVAGEAEEARRTHLRHNARYMPEAKALELMGSWTSARAAGLHTMLSLAVATGDAAFLRGAWDARIRSRAMVTDEIAARHRAWSSDPDPEVRRLAASYDSASRRLSRLEIRGVDPARPAESRTRIEAARAERDRAEGRLAERSAGFRNERFRDRLGLDSVLALLPPGSALVAYARYQPVERRGAAFVSPPSWLAFVATHGGEPALLPLGPEREVSDLVREWRKEIQSAILDDRRGGAAERRYRQVATRLRRAVWDPIASHLGGVQRVFVVPDGPLGLVNLASLPVGTHEYLIERGPLIHYLTAERDLGLGVEPTPTTGGLLAIGAPAFDADPATPAVPDHLASASGQYRGPGSDCVAFRDVRFGALQAAGRELDAIVTLWREGGPRSDAIAGAGTSIDVLSGPMASEAEFRARAPGRRVIHMATHGFFVSGECLPVEAESRGIGGMIQPAVAGTPAAAPAAHPLRLSGLALAGANHRTRVPPDQDDGILTAEEIASMDLTGVGWAVLSACETGVGEFRSGEGVMGFRRAFQVAGARTTIMSLWRVRDREVTAWMRTLYASRWRQGLDTSESVRAAALGALRARRAAGMGGHPAHWGAFIANGDWR